MHPASWGEGGGARLGEYVHHGANSIESNAIMPHRQKESHESALKAGPSPASSGKEPVRTVETSAATPPAS